MSALAVRSPARIAAWEGPSEGSGWGHTTALDEAVKVFTLMTEGMSIRAISRVTGIHKNTILALLLTVGVKCALVFNAKVRNLRPRYIEAKCWRSASA